MSASDEFKFKREKPSFYVGDELHRVKAEKIQQAMQKHGFDALLIFQSPSVRYITDFFTKGYRPMSMDLEYLAVVPKGREPILGYHSGSDTWRVKLRSLTEDARKLPSYSKWPETIAQIFKDYGLTKGTVGTDMLPWDMYLSLKQILPSVEFKNASHVWAEITAIKHPIEIEYIRKALEISMVGMRAAQKAIKDGVPEWKVAVAVEYATRMAGSELPAGIVQVASGMNSAIFERICTEKIIRNEELVMVDYAPMYRGYLGDLARTYICGKPSKIQKEIFRVQLGSLNAAIDAIKPGVKCSEIDSIARQYIKDSGYEKYMHKFATGHQLGFGLHGEPMIAPGVEEKLQPNMVVCLEPRVQLWDQWDVGGVTNEDAILVTETGHEVISKDLGYDNKLMDP